MKDGRFDEELRKAFGNDAALLLQLKQYPDRARIERILSDRKREIGARGPKMKNVKRAAARKAKLAVTGLLQAVVDTKREGQPEPPVESFPVQVIKRLLQEEKLDPVLREKLEVCLTNESASRALLRDLALCIDRLNDSLDNYAKSRLLAKDIEGYTRAWRVRLSERFKSREPKKLNKVSDGVGSIVEDLRVFVENYTPEIDHKIRAVPAPFEIVSAATYVDHDAFNPAMVIALLQESIDTSTHDGIKEWQMLESYTVSNNSVESLLKHLRLWIKKLGIQEPTSSNWVDVWKLYYARKSASIIVSNRMYAHRLAASIATHMDTEHEYSPKTIREYLLALATGEDESAITAYIQKETDTPEKLIAFAREMLYLAGKCDAPHPEDGENAAPAPVSVLLAAAAQMLFFKVKQRDRSGAVKKVAGDKGATKVRTEMLGMLSATESDLRSFTRNADGSLTESSSGAKSHVQGVTVLADAPQLSIILGSGQSNRGDVTEELTGVHQSDFAAFDPTDGVVSTRTNDLDATSGVWLKDDFGSTAQDKPMSLEELAAITSLPQRAVPTIGAYQSGTSQGASHPFVTHTVETTDGVSQAEKAPTKVAVRATRATLRNALAFSSPFAALAVSGLLAFAGAGRSPTATAIAPHADVYVTQHVPLLTASTSPSVDQKVTAVSPSFTHDVGARITQEPRQMSRLLFHSGPVLPQGINSCIHGSAKNILRNQFGIVGEVQLEDLASKAETAIRSVRHHTLHTEPGDEVSLAYDNLTGWWTVRQIRHGTMVAEAWFESGVVEVFPTNSYLKPNLLHTLSHKVKGWWQSFKNFWV